MRLVFAGTPEVAVPSLSALLDSSHEVAAVVTRPDAPAGRGRTLRPSPVKEQALEAGVEVLTPVSARDPEFLRRLSELAPEACPVVAYGNLLPAPVLAVPTHGWINLHFSLLPAWRGAAPVQHAVIAGDEFTGASTFLLEEGLDTGPVLGAMTEPVRPQDTAGELLDRLASAGASLLVATLDAVESGAASPVVQPADGVSLAPKLTTEDARVRWGMPVAAVDRRIRGCTPAPGAWTTFRGGRIKLGPVIPVDDDQVRPVSPGAMVVTRRDVFVGTATTPVRLGTVQPQGKRPMAAADWARGARVMTDEILGE
ncbi:methionyl-tRNA formyltransferase [Austwickia chelonae]|uniref:Methionyl-tRNA formyltransferase n=1 Tax=Austwickia chelonae NBRC 105200 TaxID=1184607 RepID=K6V618_9MICO|nr:methionyl-tRNA formyltransferase [Austwickia chelonae]GAB77673.1 methionyl-tRNA formyltransferase [Austwickia chelonae NBRC 105200]SEW15445.1 methionyl-tRNA formyltransferase [Austwickia chelonae]